MLDLELKLAEALAALRDAPDASLPDDEDEIIEFFSARARWHAPRRQGR